MDRRAFLAGALALMVASRFAFRFEETEADVAITGTFTVVGYTFRDGNVVVEVLFPNPGPGQPTNHFVGIPEPEIPSGSNQTQIINVVKKYVNLQVGGGHAGLNTLVANATPITIP